MTDFRTKLEAAVASIEEGCRSEASNTLFLETIEAYTYIRDGFAKGTVTTIGGTTGIGKTPLAINLTYELAVNEKASVLFLTLQDTCQIWMKKFIALACEIPLEHIFRSSFLFGPNDWKRLDQSAGKFMDSSISLEVNTHEISQVINLIKKTKEEKKIQFVIIDYLQLMDVANSQPSYRYADIDYIMRELKALAIELDVAIIIFSEIKKHREFSTINDKSCRPTLEDFRGSDSIVENSDVVMLIDRPECHGIYVDKKGNDLHNLFMIQFAKGINERYFDTFWLRFDHRTGKMKVPEIEEPKDEKDKDSSKEDRFLFPSPPPGVDGHLPL